MGNRKLISKLITLACNKVEDANKKYSLQQKAVRKDEILNQSNNLKAAIKPHLTTILNENLFFQGNNRIDIPECFWDEKNSLYRIRVDVIVTTKCNLERPRVLLSLNDSLTVYAHKLRLDKQEELLELNSMAEAGNCNSVDLQIAFSQLERKYAILSHQMKFHSINCIKEDALTIARIWLGFW